MMNKLPSRSPLSAWKQKLKRESEKKVSLIKVTKPSNRRIDRSTSRRSLIK